MRLVPIQCVKDGTYLAKTIFDNDGILLLKSGVKLNKTLINKIKQLCIYYIYVNDEYSKNEIDDIIKPEIREKFIQILKETFNNALDLYTKNNEVSKQNQFDLILKMAEQLLNEVLSKDDIMINLVDIKSMDNYTYQHCVNVAILSLVLGIELNLSRNELLNLCIGALLHDIGKVFIPKNILNKKGHLTEQEFKLMQKHTINGYAYLNKNFKISRLSAIIVLQHHEKINGTGYPNKLFGNSINKLSKIVAIADVYDALTSHRPYRAALDPSEAIEYILGNGNTHFDYIMVKSFASVIVPYPKGCLVKLSTGDIAIVEHTYKYYPLRPTVKILRSENEHIINTYINLMKELNIVIKHIIYDF